MPTAEQLISLQLQDTADPEVRLQILAYRMAVLTREKEKLEDREAKLEDRVAKLETAYTMGKGIFWALPILGVIIGYITANWGWLAKPWIPQK
jgi:hypothetical protein